MKFIPLQPFDTFVQNISPNALVVVANPLDYNHKLSIEPTIHNVHILRQSQLILVQSLSELYQILEAGAFEDELYIKYPTIEKLALYGVFKFIAECAKTLETCDFIDQDDCTAQTITKCLHALYNIGYYRDIDIIICDDSGVDMPISSSDDKEIVQEQQESCEGENDARVLKLETEALANSEVTTFPYLDADLEKLTTDEDTASDTSSENDVSPSPGSPIEGPSEMIQVNTSHPNGQTPMADITPEKNASPLDSYTKPSTIKLERLLSVWTDGYCI